MTFRRVEIDDQPMRVRPGAVEDLLPVVDTAAEIEDDTVVGSPPRRCADAIDDPAVDRGNRETSRCARVEQINDDPVRILEPEYLEGGDVRGTKYHPRRIRPVVQANVF